MKDSLIMKDPLMKKNPLMMKNLNKQIFTSILLAFMLCRAADSLLAQDSGTTVSSDISGILNKQENGGFPQWAKDLRRFDIVTFGAFPLAYLFTSLGWDLYRTSQHNWSGNYFTIAGGAAWGNDDFTNVLIYSAAVCVTVALVDYIIVRVKRSKKEKRARAFIPNEPIIQRKPLETNTANTTNTTNTTNNK